MDHQRFPSKLLIAGEFTVLSGGDAFAIPFQRFGGTWTKEDQVDRSLLPFANFLLPLSNLDAEKLIWDIEQGWQFISNIPPGYGLGSSGALSAAIYKHYARLILSPYEDLRNQLASIENYFHGKSSGFDPLISFTQQGFAILDRKLIPLEASRLSDPVKPIPLYLIDSGVQRSGINSIAWYYEALEQKSFREKTEILSMINKELTLAWDHGRHELFTDLFYRISELQFELFQPLITPGILHYWEQGLRSGDYFIKLCGKGGGGYYLMWEVVPTKNTFKELTRIPVF